MAVTWCSPCGATLDAGAPLGISVRCSLICAPARATGRAATAPDRGDTRRPSLQRPSRVPPLGGRDTPHTGPRWTLRTARAVVHLVPGTPGWRTRDRAL